MYKTGVQITLFVLSLLPHNWPPPKSSVKPMLADIAGYPILLLRKSNPNHIISNVYKSDVQIRFLCDLNNISFGLYCHITHHWQRAHLTQYFFYCLELKSGPVPWPPSDCSCKWLSAHSKTNSYVSRLRHNLPQMPEINWYTIKALIFVRFCPKVRSQTKTSTSGFDLSQ